MSLARSDILVLWLASAVRLKPDATGSGSVRLQPDLDAVAQTRVDVVEVVSKPVERQVKLPGELQPYLAVPIYARVSGFVKHTDVDRGSAVKQGQTLATIEAPEMQAQIVEAESKAQALELQRAEAAARLAAAESTYDRLKAAAATPGVVAEN